MEKTHAGAAAASCGGVGVGTVCFIVFTICKLAKVMPFVEWSWLKVILLPFAISIITPIVILLAILVITLLIVTIAFIARKIKGLFK